ncbi:CYTH domain-containing protein [Microbacterium sp. CJ88]|uniref:CYTH domain-containing protein n=1 Tax=Microbacterium sp. CJ88 TaxID=3445672 RepID=UPI003F65FA35
MTAGGASAGEPSRSVEVERKFDVDHDTPFPEWMPLPGVTTVDPAEHRTLDARYYDTADVALARAGYALRRRTGGPDEGWHVKGPLVDGGRVELGWPLGDDETIPDAVRAEVAAVTGDPLTPLARIENDRVVHSLRDHAGALVAEVVDDHVRGTDLRAGDVRTWREWEIELGPAGPVDPAAREAFFTAVGELALAAGARPAASASKLARALGR